MLLELVIVLEINVFLALLCLVERRLRDVDVSALDELGHLPIEERQQQRADVRAIDVRVGHDDDPVIAELVDVVLVLAEARAERGDQRDDLLRAYELVEARALDVEDLAAQRKDGLELAIASLLRGPAGGITLDQINFAQCRIALLAVGELSGEAHAVEHALAARELARLARRFARTRRLDDLRANDLRVDGLLEQEFGELRANDLLDDRLHFGADELVLGLRRELRLGYLDGQHARQAFAHVVPRCLHFRFLGDVFLLDVAVERTRHRLPQARQVRAAVALRNVVREALHRFGIRIVPLHRDLDGDAVLLADRVEDLWMQHRLAAVHELDEALDAAGVREVLALAVALVDELDLDAVVQERKLANALRENLVVILDPVERPERCHEMHFG